jgi:hypothetical protein
MISETPGFPVVIHAVFPYFTIDPWQIKSGMIFFNGSFEILS